MQKIGRVQWFSLQKSLAHGAADQGAANGDGLEDGMVVLEGGVDLHQVHGDEAASLVDGLADVVALTERKSAADGGTYWKESYQIESEDEHGVDLVFFFVLRKKEDTISKPDTDRKKDGQTDTSQAQMYKNKENVPVEGAMEGSRASTS